MGRPIQEMTREDWKKIIVFLMKTNQLVWNADRAQAQAASEAGKPADVDRHPSSYPDYWWTRPEIKEVIEAAHEIDDMTWLKLGYFVGIEVS